jgi:phosphoglycerate dehydrogenase-like enzyme
VCAEIADPSRDGRRRRPTCPCHQRVVSSESEKTVGLIGLGRAGRVIIFLRRLVVRK